MMRNLLKNIATHRAASIFSQTVSLSSHKHVCLSHSYFVSDEHTSKKGIPIIILHGLLGSKNNWKSLAKVISINCNREVYTLDARNHGESPHTKDFDYALMAEDVKNFAEQCKNSKFVLLGHSMGGRTAMTLALKHPELIEKLVIIDVSPFGMPDDSTVIPTYMSTMKEVIKSLPPNCSLTEARNLANDLMAKAIPEKDIRFFLLTNLTTKEGQFDWKVNLDTLMGKFTSSIRHFPLPEGSYEGRTLFICGGKSKYVRQDEHEAIRQVFPDAKFIYIPGAGHWVHSERPKEFLLAVQQFL